MPRHRLIAWPLLGALLAVALVGCGISTSEGSSTTEVFKSLSLTGSFVPGGELTLKFDSAQPYNTSLDVQCDVLTQAKAKPTPTPTTGEPKLTPTPPHIPAPEETPANRVAVVFTTSIGPNVNGSTADEATPVLGNFSHRFRAPDKPGNYKLRCFTPADDNNHIIKAFTIEPGVATASN